MTPSFDFDSRISWTSTVVELDMAILAFFGSCFIFSLCTALILDWKALITIQNFVDRFFRCALINKFSCMHVVMRICLVVSISWRLIHVLRVCGSGLPVILHSYFQREFVHKIALSQLLVMSCVLEFRNEYMEREQRLCISQNRVCNAIVLILDYT